MLYPFCFKGRNQINSRRSGTNKEKGKSLNILGHENRSKTLILNPEKATSQSSLSSPSHSNSAMADNENSIDQNGHHPQIQSNNFMTHSLTMSPLTASTVLRVQQRSRTLNPAIRYALHDNTSPAYRWLLPGWLAEERTVANGRVYRVRPLDLFDVWKWSVFGAAFRVSDEN